MDMQVPGQVGAQPAPVLNISAGQVNKAQSPQQKTQTREAVKPNVETQTPSQDARSANQDAPRGSIINLVV